MGGISKIWVLGRGASRLPHIFGMSTTHRVVHSGFLNSKSKIIDVKTLPLLIMKHKIIDATSLPLLNSKHKVGRSSFEALVFEYWIT